MTGTSRLALLAASLGLSAPLDGRPALAQQSHQPFAVKIVDWGVPNARTVGQESTPETALGRNQLVDPFQDVPVRRADQLEACFGTRFGVKFRLKGEDAASAPADGVPITVEVSHPPMRAPDGRTLTVSRWPGAAVPYTRFTGWEFEEPYELLPGTWTVALRNGNRLLDQHSFQVTIRNDCVPPAS